MDFDLSYSFRSMSQYRKLLAERLASEFQSIPDPLAHNTHVYTHKCTPTPTDTYYIPHTHMCAHTVVEVDLKDLSKTRSSCLLSVQLDSWKLLLQSD